MNTLDERPMENFTMEASGCQYTNPYDQPQCAKSRATRHYVFLMCYSVKLKAASTYTEKKS